VDIPLKNDMRVLLLPKLRLDGIHIIARSFIVRQSKTILARSSEAGKGRLKNWQRNGNREPFPSKIVDFESSASANSAMPGDLKGT
jgi:hypothetical protein